MPVKHSHDTARPATDGYYHTIVQNSITQKNGALARLADRGFGGPNGLLPRALRVRPGRAVWEEHQLYCAAGFLHRWHPAVPG